jgi:hypothetical protein
MRHDQKQKAPVKIGAMAILTGSKGGQKSEQTKAPSKGPNEPNPRGLVSTTRFVRKTTPIIAPELALDHPQPEPGLTSQRRKAETSALNLPQQWTIGTFRTTRTVQSPKLNVSPLGHRQIAQFNRERTRRRVRANPNVPTAFPPNVDLQGALRRWRCSGAHSFASGQNIFSRLGRGGGFHKGQVVSHKLW